MFEMVVGISKRKKLTLDAKEIANVIKRTVSTLFSSEDVEYLRSASMLCGDKTGVMAFKKSFRSTAS